MRVVAWILLAFLAATLFHTRLIGWPVAPDLPWALAAWAVVVGAERHWVWRVWLLGLVRDLVDPGSQWFHAAAHLVLVVGVMPLRRWLPGLPWLALLVTGTGLVVAERGLDVLVSGGGLSPARTLIDALLTGGAAVLLGRLVPGPKRTVVIDEAESAPEPQPERSAGS